MVKAVLMDVDNTLLDFNECARESIRRGFGDWGLEFRDEMFDIFRRTNDSLWLEIENGTLTRENLREIRWNLIFSQLGIEADGKSFEWVFQGYLDESAVTVEGALETVKYLSGKYTVCAASNAPMERQINRLKKSGFYPFLRHIFTSGELGYSKPSKDFFDGCFKRLPGISPQETIMIGDSLTADIRGGANYGIKTCWFNFYGEKNSTDITPDYIVDSLYELKNFL